MKKYLFALVGLFQVLFIFNTALANQAMPLPSTPTVISYDPVTQPIPNADPWQARPFSFGNTSTGIATIRAAFAGFEGSVDIYLAIFAEPYGSIYLIDSSYNLLPLTNLASAVPWIAYQTEAMDEVIFTIDIAYLLAGYYTGYAVVVPAGTDLTNFSWETSPYYLWYFTVGINVFSQTIGPEGGIIEVTDPSSPLYGVRVEIPAGALEQETAITIGQAAAVPSLPPELTPLSPIVTFQPEGLYFNLPVKITIPYDGSNGEETESVFPYTYNKSDQYWSISLIVNRESHYVEILIYHFSNRTVAKRQWDEPPETHDTGFRPRIHGFPIPNTGGWCGGMTTFAKWFFYTTLNAAVSPQLKRWQRK